MFKLKNGDPAPEIDLTDEAIGKVVELGMQAANGVASWVAARTKHIQLNGTTDYVTLQGYQASGGSLNTSASASDAPSMCVRWVHN